MFITLLTNKAAHPFFKLLFFPGFNKHILLLINPHFFIRKCVIYMIFFFWGGEGGGAIIVSRSHIVIFQYNYIIHRLQSQASTACFLATSLLRDEWKEVLRGTSRRGPGGQLLIKKKTKAKKKRLPQTALNISCHFFITLAVGRRPNNTRTGACTAALRYFGLLGRQHLSLSHCCCLF